MKIAVSCSSSNDMMNKIYDEKFTSSKVKQCYDVVNNSKEVIELINKYNLLNKEKNLECCRK